MIEVTKVLSGLGMNYTLKLRFEPVSASGHDAGVWFGAGSEVDVVGDLFREVIVRARNELTEGLGRGGVAELFANMHPRHYLSQVRAYLHQVAWNKSIANEGIAGGHAWNVLVKWKPNPERFQTWFGINYATLATPSKEWFRNTILGTVLGMLGSSVHRFEFTTGNAATLGASLTLFDHRVEFQMPRVWESLALNGDFGNQRDDPAFRLSQRLRPGDFARHPCAFQVLPLSLINESCNFGLHVIKLKRPAKVESRGDPTDWYKLWRQTLFHESSHAYACTDDYFYYSTNGGFHWFMDAACQANVNAVAGPLPWIQNAGPAGAILPAGASPDFPLANAESIAAYLCGWHDPRFYPHDV